MPSTIEQLSPTRVKLTVEIPFADLKPHLDKAYKEIAGQVNIPGFRKGKVPAAVIDQRFGRGVVLQEAINAALPLAYNAAVQEHELAPLSQPEVDVTKLEDNELVEFTAEVDVRPAFDLPEFDKVAVEVDAAESVEEGIEERIELLRKRFATRKEVERKAKKGDVVTVDLKASQNGEALDDASAEGVPVELGADKNLLDGLEDAIVGLKAGESATFTSKLLGGAHRGEEADIEVSVSKVEEQELPEVDEEFAQMVSEFDTVEEMREDLRKAVEAAAKQKQLMVARDKVVEAIVEATSFELPEKLLKSELDARRQQVERQLAGAGLSIEQYLEQSEEEEAKTADEFWAELAKQSEQALRAQIILDKYAEENKVEVSQQDLTELIFQKAQMNGTTPQQEIQHMMEHDHMAAWMGEVRRSKSLAAICDSAVIKDVDGNVVEMPKFEESEAAEESDQA
ncbi:trigger factor [Tessaracoccus sp. OH4464_COT-324]|uniref:trigger factor n=1 Tax=Tessaracoccus sp. OH4464_COT-324 TaxID=2491059 RepID=UPI000F63FE85|nr:trigger factor [Tessaracoccus sp. OH4464_COT-324]RRD46883.1 trigger factor [Tessaracoccus sp. OH4464_COT-324]